jgi:hypothetical protein
MAAARRATNGVEPTFDNPARPPCCARCAFEFREAVACPNFQGRMASLGACDLASAVYSTNFVFVRSEVNAASRRHDSPDQLNIPLTLSSGLACLLLPHRTKRSGGVR